MRSEIVKERNLGIPSQERGYVDLIRDAGLMGDDAAAKLHLLRGLRNRLVHAYGELDDEKVYENLTSHMEDFEAVIRALRKIIGRK